MRSARYLFSAAVLPGGQVIVAGGCNPSLQCKPLSSAEIFDMDAGPGGGIWSPLPDMQTGREGSACCCTPTGRSGGPGRMGGQFVVLGGRTGSDRRPDSVGRSVPKYLDTVEVFDLHSRSWTDGPVMPAGGRFGAAACCLGGQVIVLGGANGLGPTNSVEAWDTLAAVPRWLPLPEMLSSRCMAGAGVLVRTK